MSLLKNYITLIMAWTTYFVRTTTFCRCSLHAIASLTEGQRKTITHNIRILNKELEDFSSHYKLYSRDQWDPQNLFKPVIMQSGLFDSEDYIQIVGDFTTIRKTGKHIPFTATCRDPMSPKYHPNLIWGMIFLQLSFIAPLYKTHGLPARSLPIQWDVLPRLPKPRINDKEEKWTEYRNFQKENNRSDYFVKQLTQLRHSIDEAGWASKRLLVSLDGDFCNRKVLNAPRDRIDLLLRARKNIKLCYRAIDEGRRFYSSDKFTPEGIRQDEKIEWKSSQIFHGGEWRKVDYKEVKDVYWQTGAKRQPLRLIVVRPIPYRRTKKGKLLYRQPAYLITTDLLTDVEKLLQAYFDRWEIEVNHKEEKHILGVGQAQIRNENSIRKQTSLVVASYSILLLASISEGCIEEQANMKEESQWYKNSKRPSCNSLRKKLLKEIQSSEIDLFHLFYNAMRTENVA